MHDSPGSVPSDGLYGLRVPSHCSHTGSQQLLLLPRLEHEQCWHTVCTALARSQGRKSFRKGSGIPAAKPVPSLGMLRMACSKAYQLASRPYARSNLVLCVFAPCMANRALSVQQSLTGQTQSLKQLPPKGRSAVLGAFTCAGTSSPSRGLSFASSVALASEACQHGQPQEASRASSQHASSQRVPTVAAHWMTWTTQ